MTCGSDISGISICDVITLELFLSASAAELAS